MMRESNVRWTSDASGVQIVVNIGQHYASQRCDGQNESQLHCEP